jgi:LysR family hydrogen peroxide-inducible transcriptional activator
LEAPALTLKELRYLVAVADLRHFGRAAERCNVTQPTLSAQIMKLESYLGLKLLERTSHTVRLTPVGREIAALARVTVDTAQLIKETALAHREKGASSAGIGRLQRLP